LDPEKEGAEQLQVKRLQTILAPNQWIIKISCGIGSLCIQAGKNNFLAVK